MRVAGAPFAGKMTGPPPPRRIGDGPGGLSPPGQGQDTVWRARGGPPAAQQLPPLGIQLGFPEGPGQAVVHAGGTAALMVGVEGVGRERQHGNIGLRRHRMRPHQGHGLQPVHAGHLNGHQHQVEGLLGKPGHPAGAVHGFRDHHAPGLHGAPGHEAVDVVALHQQHPRAGQHAGVEFLGSSVRRGPSRLPLASREMPGGVPGGVY